MIISGLQKTTLLDYPGHVAATIFTGGCNFRCSFCHNMNIVLDSRIYANEDDTEGMDGELSYNTYLDEEEILKFLKKRSGVLDGVCITGGEPTLNCDLIEFIRKIKTFDLLVKLDTNGTNPKILRKLIEEKLIDYIAMDIKTSLENYAGLSGSNDAILIDNITESVNLIMESGIDYEFRTTVVSELHDENAMIGIGKLISGAKRYFLQPFVDSEYVPDHNLTAPDKDTLNKYCEMLKGYVDRVSIRGVD